MIVFSQLSRDYTLGSQTVRALQYASGKVFAGEMVALCGPSGSGKVPYSMCLACWIHNIKVR